MFTRIRLKSVLPKIKRSPAYQDGGLIAITFDQAPQTSTDVPGLPVFGAGVFNAYSG